MAYSTNLYVIAAICGNFYQESTINPGIWEGLVPNNPGYGLGQWTDNPPIVMRRTALFDWLDANNYAHDSGDGQLEFLIYENVWLPNNPNFPTSAYPTLTDYLHSTSTNISDLVEEFMWHWEGIDDGSFSTRLNAANRIYNVLLTRGSDPYRKPWYSGNYFLSDAQGEWNALLIMDFFLGDTPVPPGPTPGPVPPYHRARKGLPPWLIYKLTKGEF